MKKKFALLLGMLLVVASMLGACGTDPEKTDYNGVSYDELKTNMQTYIYNVVTALPSFLEQQGMSISDLEDERTAESLTSNYGVPEILIDPTISYQNVSEEYGECVNFTFSTDGVGESTDPDDIGFSVDKAGKTLTTSVQLVLNNDKGDRKVDFQVIYNYNSMQVTGISIDPVLSMGEKMSKAGLNTVISICIVFAVLILISLIIYAFNVFPYLEKKKKDKQLALERAASNAVGTTPLAAPTQESVDIRPAAEETVDDGELIAVIAAAIAAGTGTSTNDFVVRSINRR